MDYTILLKKVEDHVTQYFEANANPQLFYHSLAHSQGVVLAVDKMATHYELDERSKFILTCAAWFHDIGYLSDNKNHELRSTELAEPFLKNEGVGEEDIFEIKKCILATIMPQDPQTLMEKIICDSDMFYLGTGKYKSISKLLKKEWDAQGINVAKDEIEWSKLQIKFLDSHQFHTHYCRLLLNKKKAENLADLVSKQQKKSNDPNAGETNISDLERKKKSKKEKGSKKNDSPARGVQTMFRVSTTNSVRVSVMADNKAHIMISVNSIIISVVLALLVRNVDAYMHFLIPTIMLVSVNLITIIYSVLATRPKVANGRFTEKQVEDKSVNLLFFGSFYKMEYPEYHGAVKKMMKDPEFLYGNLTKDVFWQGKVLGRKYRLLRTAYNIFMYGMVLTVLSFLAAAFIFP